MKIIVFLCTLGIAEFAIAETFPSIAKEVARFYSPFDQGLTDKLKQHTGRRPFKGDCDDYAAAMASRLTAAGLPVQMYVVTHRRGTKRIPHIVTCSDGMCVGSIYKRPYRKGEKFRGEWRPARLGDAPPTESKGDV